MNLLFSFLISRTCNRIYVKVNCNYFLTNKSEPTFVREHLMAYTNAKSAKNNG